MNWQLVGRSACFATLFLLLACEPSQPQLGSQTNWIKACDTSDECGLMECLCGACTVSCSDQAECTGQGIGVCVPPADAGSISLCGGTTPTSGMCLARCDDSPCPTGTNCVSGVCQPSIAPDAHVIIDPDVRHQSLIGFGASIAGSEVAITEHPDKSALYEAMFSQSGFDILRMNSRFGDPGTEALTAGVEIVTEVTAALGQKPYVIMTSASPPPSLKANGSRLCSSDDPNCTLARDAEGAFDYAGFAEYWRGSLEAYEAAGLHPDLVSIQSNVDWIPPEEVGSSACRFLPEEGTMTMTAADGQTIEAEFPGYLEALTAVQSAVATLGSEYSFAAPEAGSTVMVQRYTDVLSSDSYEAIALHSFGTDPAAIDPPHLEGLRELAASIQKPLMQTEMEAGGLETAMLTHYFLALTDASAYLQAQFVSPTVEDGSLALIGLEADTFQTMPAYHALAHFARNTAPGWLRVDATNDSSALLSTAWLAPDELGLTVVLINPGDTPIAAQISLAAPLDALLDNAEVTRTTFDGVERSARQGELSLDRIVRVPSHAAVTVASVD
jgi:hypothetical protein